MNKLEKREKLFLGLLVALLILICTIVISKKTNLHVDEVYTYGLANHQYVNTFNMNPEEGKLYEPAEEAWDEYMQVQAESTFDYGNVWANQEADVHPPLYYVLVHTVCSFFPEQYSIWFAGVINIIFAALTLLAVYFLTLSLTKSKKVSCLAAIFFMLSAGLLSAVAFMRMYIMAMFWVTLITFLAVKGFSEKRNFPFFVQLFAASVAGILTHYYFLIYLFFMCCTWGILLFFEKRFREILKLLLTIMLSGITALMIFPAMVQQILNGNRGVEAVDNLRNTSLSEYIDRLSTFFGFINEQIFGGLLPVIMVGFALALILGIRKKALFVNKKIMLTAVPCLGYFIIVAKIAAYSYDRYIQPIYPVVAVLGCCMITYIWHTVFLNKKAIGLAVPISLAVITVFSLVRCRWTYLYRESEQLLARASEKSEYRCIYIYDALWKVQPSFYEMQNYKSVVFIAQDHLDLLDSLKLTEEKGLIVCIMDSCDAESIWKKLNTLYPVTGSPEILGQYFFATTYFISE